MRLLAFDLRRRHSLPRAQALIEWMGSLLICRQRPRISFPRIALIAMVLMIAACAGPTARKPNGRSPDEVRAQLIELMPTRVRDRQAWASDIQSAFVHVKITQSTENLCAALAVIEQETGYQVDPVVPNLARIARQEIERRAARLKVPKWAVEAALELDSGDGRSYGERIAAVRTERDMSELFEEFIGRVPLGQQLFGQANPVHTGGPMQVSIAFSERHAGQHGYPYPLNGSIRREVFTRRGGLHFGIAHLLAYPNSYSRHLYRFADFNAGWYASRNAAMQSAIAQLSGQALALDGDLMLPEPLLGSAAVSKTEAALRTLAPALSMSAKAIRRDLRKADTIDFEQTQLYEELFALAERNAGRPLPRAMLPRIRLESPKITRQLTTAWFAERVQGRYQNCVNRAFANLP